MAREGKSYLQIVRQWKRITDELERRSGGVEYAISGDRNIALYERATDAARCYTRNIEHSPEGMKHHPGQEGKRFLDKVFPRSAYMGQDIRSMREESAEMTRNSPAEDKDQVFYASVAYLQYSQDTKELDRILESKDYDRFGPLLPDYDPGEAPSQEYISRSPTGTAHDDVVYEDRNYALVYNSHVGGTFDILRKLAEDDVRALIGRYGLEEHASDDVREVARAMSQYYDMGRQRTVTNTGTELPDRSMGSETQTFDHVSVFRMKDGSYAIRGDYEGCHLPSVRLSDSELKAYRSSASPNARESAMQQIMAVHYAEEINHRGQENRHGLSR